MTMTRLISLAMFSLLVSVPATALAESALVGAWKITITPDDDARQAGEKKEIEDTITLKGSKFVSAKWKKDHKFEPVDYEEDSRRGPVAKFTAEPESKLGGKMKWTGQVTGNAIKGEITWTKLDGTILNYAYEGEKQ